MFLRGAQPHTQLKPGIFRYLPNGNRIQSCFKQCRYRPGKLQTLEHTGTNTGCSQRNANGCHSHSEGYKLPRILLFPLLRYPETRKQTLTVRDLLQNNWGFQQSSATDRHGSVSGAQFGSRKPALPGGRCAAAAGIQTSLGCATEQLLPALTGAGSKLFSSYCLRPPLTSLGEAAQEWPMRSDRTGERKSDQRHLDPSTWVLWHPPGTCSHSTACTKEKMLPESVFFLRFLFCRHLGGKCAADQMVQSNAFHQICGFGPWGSPSSPQTLVPPPTRGSWPSLPARGNQSWAGQGANTKFMAWRCLRGCSYSHSATPGSWGAATTGDHWTQMPKLRAQHRPQRCVNTLIPAGRHTPPA